MFIISWSFSAGVPNLIRADMVKEGVCVIDVGITRIIDKTTGKSQLVGDVDFEGEFSFVMVYLKQDVGYYLKLWRATYYFEVDRMELKYLMLDVQNLGVLFSKFEKIFHIMNFWRLPLKS